MLLAGHAVRAGAETEHMVGSAVGDLAAVEAGRRQLSKVVLSGGVFQNRLLLEAVARRIRSAGLDVLTHRRFPANDGGIALGQAAVAAARSIEKANW